LAALKGGIDRVPVGLANGLDCHELVGQLVRVDTLGRAFRVRSESVASGSFRVVSRALSISDMIAFLRASIRAFARSIRIARCIDLFVQSGYDPVVVLVLVQQRTNDLEQLGFAFEHGQLQLLVQLQAGSERKHGEDALNVGLGDPSMLRKCV
jgi:hypothetical protein